MHFYRKINYKEDEISVTRVCLWFLHKSNRITWTSSDKILMNFLESLQNTGHFSGGFISVVWKRPKTIKLSC